MESTTFPQPTRPSSYSNLTSFKYSSSMLQHSEPTIIHQVSEQSTSTSDQQQDKDKEELFGELIRILFECLENVDNEHKGFLLRKIFLELEKESQVENFIVEKLKHSQVKLIYEFLERYQERSPDDRIDEDEVNYDQQETISCRGFKEDLMQEEGTTNGSKSQCSHKLERFKVKTIQIEGGVIKK